MTLTFTTVCTGDVVRVGSDSRRVCELEFNQSKPILVAEGVVRK